MCQNNKRGQNRAKKERDHQFFTCKVCEEKVTELVSDPRYPLKQQHLCCKACAQKFKNRPELKFGQKMRRSKEPWYPVIQTAR